MNSLFLEDPPKDEGSRARGQQPADLAAKCHATPQLIDHIRPPYYCGLFVRVCCVNGAHSPSSALERRELRAKFNPTVSWGMAQASCLDLHAGHGREGTLNPPQFVAGGVWTY